MKNLKLIITKIDTISKSANTHPDNNFFYKKLKLKYCLPPVGQPYQSNDLTNSHLVTVDIMEN